MTETNFGFEVLRAVSTKSTIFWVITTCSLVEFHRSSSETLLYFYSCNPGDHTLQWLVYFWENKYSLLQRVEEFVGSEFLTAVVLKSTIFWDVTPCSPLKINRRFGGKYRSACHLLSRWFLGLLIFRPWRWRRYVPPKRRLALTGLHCVMSQKIVLFITTAVRTSNPQ
jgi:hypothetical protein